MSDVPSAFPNTVKIIKARRPGANITSHNGAYLSPVPWVDWIQQHFYLYDTAELITLHERQRRPLVEALREEDGRFVYSTILWSWPKKSAKSSIIAAICLYVLCNQERAAISLIANDLRQADSRVGYYLREAIKIAEKKGDQLGHFKITPSGYRIENLDNGAFVEMLPIDPNGEAGGNSDLIVFSELHGWTSKAHQRMWGEMTLSPNKFRKSRRIVDTYAGYASESPILEELYHSIVRPEYQLWGEDWEVYANPQTGLFATWVTQWHLPWQLGESGRAYYAEEAAMLTPNDFNRLHHNQWVTSADVFVPGEWWDACQGEIPTFDTDTPVVVGMDAAVSGDCFALVGVSRREETVYVRFVQAWTPPKDGKIDFSDVETFIREQVVTRYNVVQICYDPYMLHDMATRLKRDGVAWMYEFSQLQPRLIADKELYDIIRDRRLVHDGYPTLTEHVKNANAATDPKEHTLRIVKRADHLKIDCCVALSMAAHEARRLNIG